MADDVPPGSDGPLAEYVSLRQEIESRASRQQSLFVLHVTTAGAVFSFALTGGGRSAFLLILPITSYLYCARYVMLHHGTQNIAEYIRDVLSPIVPGGLGWEAWHARRPKRLPLLAWTHPSFITFPGVAALALVWTIPTVFTGWQSSAWPQQAGLLALWLIGLAAAVASHLLVLTTVRRWLRQ
ncbi:hypothetical protein AB0M47_40180 [Hamadaea sp. NPDC051192]|uniref:hypothetical protein n=1 Tax=Hamadaea sp. NPDC051192 TaxID=3154940 RepID=UPI00341A5F32